jgi:Flp pilus assembly protein TadB
MTTPRTPDPPDGPRPLSDHEQRALHDLEHRLADDDPALSVQLRRPAPWREQVSDRAFNLLIQITVVVVVLVVVLPGPWAAALIVVTLMAVPGTVTVLASRRAESAKEP